MIVTIDYQCGCDGPKIGKALAERLGLAFYDTELFSKAAEESDLEEKVIETFDGVPASGPLYAVAACSSASRIDRSGNDRPIAEQVFLAEYHAIRKLAEEQPCLFIGRCADYVLQDRTDCLNFFIYAPLKSRIALVSQSQEVDEQKAKDIILNSDRRRKAYYSSFSGKKWGQVENYHLCIDSSQHELGNVVEILRGYASGTRMRAPAVV